MEENNFQTMPERNIPQVNQPPATPAFQEEPKTTTQEKSSQLLKILIYALTATLLLGLGIFGFWFYQGKIAKKAVPPTMPARPTAISTLFPPTLTPTPTSTIPANWKTYRNEGYGYEISYPDNWYISEVKEGPEKDRRVDFHSWRERDFKKVDYQVSVIVSSSDPNASLSSWLNDKISAYPEGVRKLITRQEVLFNNFSGEKVLEEISMAGVYNIYTKRENYVYNFMLVPYNPKELPQLLPESLNIFDQILSTFKFLDESQKESQNAYSCEVDSDCMVKDVHNCCGYFPKCVNKEYEPDIEAVQKRCQDLGITSSCGYLEISGCECQDNTCKDIIK